MSLHTHTLRGQELEAISKLPDLSQQASERVEPMDRTTIILESQLHFIIRSPEISTFWAKIL